MITVRIKYILEVWCYFIDLMNNSMILDFKTLKSMLYSLDSFLRYIPNFPIKYLTYNDVGMSLAAPVSQSIFSTSPKRGVLHGAHNSNPQQYEEQ